MVLTCPGSHSPSLCIQDLNRFKSQFGTYSLSLEPFSRTQNQLELWGLGKIALYLGICHSEKQIYGKHGFGSK